MLKLFVVAFSYLQGSLWFKDERSNYCSCTSRQYGDPTLQGGVPYEKQTFPEIKKQTMILKRLNQQLRGFVSLSMDLLKKMSIHKQDKHLNRTDCVVYFSY